MDTGDRQSAARAPHDHPRHHGNRAAGTMASLAARTRIALPCACPSTPGIPPRAAHADGPPLRPV